MAGATMEIEHAIGFSGRVSNGLHYHPNGKDYVSVAGGCLVVCDLEDCHEQTFLQGHDDYVSCLALSKTGKYLASGQVGQHSDVIIWDFETRKLIHRLTEHDCKVQGVDFSDDERLIVTIGSEDDHRLFVWDMETGYIVANADVQAFPPTVVKFPSAFGSRELDKKRRPTRNYTFLTASRGHITVWSLNPYDGVLVPHHCNMGSRPVVREYTCISFSKDGQYGYLGSKSGDFHCVHLFNRMLHSSVHACTGGVESLEVLDNGILVGGGDGSVVFFEGEGKTWAKAKECFTRGAVTCLSSSPTTSDVLVGTSQGYVHVLKDPGMQMRLTTKSENHSGSVTAVAFPEDVSTQFITCASSGVVRIWDCNDYHTVLEVSVPGVGAANCVVWAVQCLISGWSDGFIRCHSAQDSELLWEISNAHQGPVYSVSLCKSASRLPRFVVSGGADGRVRVWDVRNRALVSDLTQHSAGVNQVIVCQGGYNALSCSKDRSFLGWDLSAEKRIFRYTQRMGGINGMALHPNQSMVITVGQERKITFWDLRMTDSIKSIDEQAELFAVDISADGKFFVVGGSNLLVKLFDLESGKCISQGGGHSATIRCVRFSPDGKQIISVGDDGCIFIWNLYRE